MRNTPLKAFSNDDDKKKRRDAYIKKIEEDLKKLQEAKEEHRKTDPHSRYKKGPQELPKDLQ